MRQIYLSLRSNLQGMLRAPRVRGELLKLEFGSRNPVRFTLRGSARGSSAELRAAALQESVDGGIGFQADRSLVGGGSLSARITPSAASQRRRVGR